MNIDIVKIPPAQSIDESLNPLNEAYVTVDRAYEIDLIGNDDLAEDPRAMQNASVDRAYYEVHRWVAFPAGERDPSSAVGTAFVGYDLKDNTHLAQASISVRPDQRSQGVGKALLEPLTDSIRQSGRNTVATWTEMRPYFGEDGLCPKTGIGNIDPNLPAVRWLQALGFELEQSGRRNMLTLSSDLGWWAKLDERLACDLRSAGPEYELVQWAGAVPRHLQTQLAELKTQMSVDEPNAGMDFQEIAWDGERIAYEDSKTERRGSANVTSAVRHIPSDRLVAYTELMWLKSKPIAVDQEDTFVLGEHRGLRLGAILKAANLNQLRKVNPNAQRVYTWNAGENRYMLAINDELGFKVVAVEGAWQKRI